MTPRTSEEYDEPDCRPLVTRGVTSQVFGDMEVIGHVALTDWDQPPGESIPEAVRATGAPSALFLSSAGSYHLWDLGVRSVLKTDEVLHELGDDSTHREIGREREWWRIRVDPKVAGCGEVYTDKPDLIEVFLPDEYDGPVSFPHIQFLRATTGADFVGIEERAELVGETLKVLHYVTFTDDGKAVRRRAY